MEDVGYLVNVILGYMWCVLYCFLDDLCLVVLDEFGLFCVLEEGLICDLFDVVGIVYVMDMYGDLWLFDDDMCMVIYCLVQESVMNIVKYVQVSYFWLWLCIGECYGILLVLLDICDDGIGLFGIVLCGGCGLQGMCDWVIFLGGLFCLRQVFVGVYLWILLWGNNVFVIKLVFVICIVQEFF